MTSTEFEDTVGSILARHFPFGVISRVPVFNANSKEEFLFANEIDHLVHFRKDGRDHLVLVECKNQVITATQRPHGPAPKGNQRWFAHYKGSPASDVREQLRSQADCASQILRLADSTRVQFECWVVHRRKDCEVLSIHYKNGATFRAFNDQQLDPELSSILASAQTIPINRSPLLSIIQKSIPRPGAPHPAMLDALDYVERARGGIDRWLFTKLNGWFHSKDGLWALKGAAGSGKSVLLAYTLAVLATGLRVAYDPRSRRYRTVDSSSFLPAGIPHLSQRHIHACAMSGFQLEALQRHFEAFLEVLASHHRAHRPAVIPVRFSKWTGRPPHGCNVLAIDEAHDLAPPDQLAVAAWHRSTSPEDGVKGRYLIIALDRQQQIRDRLSDKRPIIEGLNFQNKTNTLSRSYRSPFAAFMASIALLFRWYADRGPMIKPGTISVGSASFGDFKTFSGGIGVKVEEDPLSHRCRIWIRNDSHPANYWSKTVDLFDSARDLHEVLRLERLTKDHVLWLSFGGRDPSGLEDRHLAQSYEYHRVSPEHPETFIDHNVKGLEFPVVVVEGLPAHYDDLEDPEALWHARRILYLCSSRATAFLYFVLPNQAAHASARTEIGRILDQLQNAQRAKPNDTGLTWTMEFVWRSGDQEALGDYLDGDGQDEAELTPDDSESEEPEPLEEDSLPD